MRKQFARQINPAAGLGCAKRHVFTSLIVAGLFLVSAAPSAQAAKGDDTVTVTKKNGAGDIIIDVSFGGSPPKPVTVTVKNTDMETDIAETIAKAIGHGATTDGEKVIVPPSGSDRISISIHQNNVAKITTNTDGYALLNGLPAGILDFNANPTTGQTVLLNNATVTAGFANGLNPVSFVALAGQSIFDLTAELNTALVGAGYATELLDSHDVEVFANGSQTPAELDLTLDSVAPAGDTGILFGTQTTPVPNPSNLALFVFGVFSLLGYSSRPRKGHEKR